jgi:hypothetical protein
MKTKIQRKAIPFLQIVPFNVRKVVSTPVYPTGANKGYPEENLHKKKEKNKNK